MMFRLNPLSEKERLKREMSTKRQLPLGKTQFEEWAERIIDSALLRGVAEVDSMKFALGSMILELGPTEAFKEDAYFIQRLRKNISNQVAEYRMREIREATKARLTAQEAVNKEASN